MPSSTLNASKVRFKKAVHRSDAATHDGMLERLFTFAFKELVYPQIWEDPDVDMEALRLTPQSRMVAIASGGCNLTSYLTADPAEITAVDLNRAHVALGRRNCSPRNVCRIMTGFTVSLARPTKRPIFQLTIGFYATTSMRILWLIGKAVI